MCRVEPEDSPGPRGPATGARALDVAARRPHSWAHPMGSVSAEGGPNHRAPLAKRSSPITGPARHGAHSADGGRRHRMRRRDVVKLLGMGALAASAPRAWAQGREVVIGVLYPLSGPVAQAGVDAKAAAETAVEIINTRQDLDLPLARTEGLPGLGGAKLRLIFVDHQGKPELGQSEAERLITQEKAAALYGAYHSSVSATASVVCERLGVPYLSGESSSPTLHRRSFKWFFRTSPHDEHFSIAMFEFLKELQARRGRKIATVGILHEDTLFGAASARVQEQ